MRKLVLAVSSVFALVSLAGCATQNAGYAGAAGVGYAYGDCEFSGDCYEPAGYEYTCVFYQPVPRIPARPDIGLSARHPPTRVVHRGEGGMSNPPPDSSASASSTSSPPPPSFAPAPVAREPVVLVSPPVDRSTRSR